MALPLPLARSFALASTLALALCACAGPGAEERAPSVPPRPAPPLADPGLTTTPVTTASTAPAAAPDPRARAEGAAPQAGGEGTGSRWLIGTAAGVPIPVEELLLSWHEVSTREIWLVVEKLVATRFAFAEAARLALVLEPGAVEAQVAKERAELEAEAEAAEGSPTAEQYVQRRFGLDPQVYFERMQGAAVRQMVAERAIRSWTLTNATREVRVLTVEREEEMRALEAEARAGADFAELARTHSSDATASAGGLVPYVVRQEHSPLARLAFDTPVGSVGGPSWVGGHGFLVRVEREREPLKGNWPELREAVEASLSETPVSDAEFIHWKIEMEQSYPVDLVPLKRLLGAQEPAPAGGG